MGASPRRFKGLCKHCKNIYEGHGDQFCSSSCSNEYRREHWSGSELRKKTYFDARMQDVAIRKYKNLLTRCKGTTFIRPRRFEFLEWYNSTPKLCEYCNISQELLEHSAAIPYQKFLQVDRMNSLIGYQTSNLVLACFRCNRVKNYDLTYEEMRFVGQQFMKPKWQARLHEVPVQKEVS